MTGEPPEDLGIELPAGERIPPPAPDEIVMQYPAFLAEGTGGVMLTATARRSTALRVLSGIAGERLHDALRRERGMAYAPSGGYTTLDADTALVTLASDCQDADAEVVLGELWGIVDALRTDGATQEELDRDRRAVERMMAEPEAGRGELDTRASNELLGHEQLTMEEWMAELQALSPADIAAAAQELASTAMLLGPESSSAPAGGFCPYATREPAPVEGRRHLQRGRPAGQADVVTIGDRGITYAPAEGSPLTIEWERCAAAEHRPDGGSLVLNAREGTWMVISSLDFIDGEVLLADVRARVQQVQIPSADADVALAVEREAAWRLEEPRQLGGELARLARVLEQSEQILELLEGRHEGAYGLFALTERRIVWMAPEAFLDIPLVEVLEVKLPRIRLVDGPMEVVAKGGTLPFEIRPMKRARELAGRIEQRAG